MASRMDCIRVVFFAALLAFPAGLAQARDIPAPKLERIRQAMAAMKVDARIEAMVAQHVEARVQRLRSANPDAPDTLFHEARSVIHAVHAERLEGRDGLFPRVHGVLDRLLTDEDLRFVTDFRGSDQGRRYRELLPRVVQESLDAGRDWARRLEPEVDRRLEERFGGRLRVRP